MSTDLWLLILLGALFVVAVFLAAAETALLRVSRVRIAERADAGSRQAQRLQRLLSDPVRVLNAILLAALGTQIGAATVAGVLASRRFSGAGVTAVSVLLTLALFVYSEAIPKTYAVRHPVRVATALAYPVAALATALRPIVSALVWFADLQAPGRGVSTTPTVTEGELLRLSATAADEGAITPTDALLIERAFTFGDRHVDEIMVPRPDIVAVPAGTTVGAALDLALEAGHRRMPVFGEDLDDTKGVVYVRTLTAAAHLDRDGPLLPHIRPALFVPESRRIVELLEDMQRGATHIAMIVDEYGGTSGLVTIEDIAAELLGAVTEDGGVPARPARRTGRHAFLLDGRMGMDDAEDVLGRELPRGEWTTIAGMLMAEAGRVLGEDDEVVVDDIRFRVARAHRQRILAVEASAAPPASSPRG